MLKKQEFKQRLAFLVTDEQYHGVQELADIEGHTVSSFLRLLIDRALAAQKALDERP